VSSFAKMDKDDGSFEHNQSVHNQTYWSGFDYIGVGPGAHGRLTNKHSLERHRTFKVSIYSNAGCHVDAQRDC
jgi:coproporphyrinogen III oxidase-like Fe-S oxidoreductase